MNKICIITPSFPNMNCGLADYVANLVRFLNARDFDISVITSCNPKIKEYMGSTKDDKTKIYPVIARWNFSALFLINRKVRKSGFDTVHIMYHWNGFNQGILKGAMISLLPFFLKAGRTERPTVVISFVHDIMGPYLFPKAGLLRKLGLFLMVLFADKLTVHTDHHKAKLMRMLLFLKKRIYRIPCGSGIFYESPIRTYSGAKDLNEKEITLSFFGYVYPAKGLEYLIEALRILKDKGYKLKLLIIGGTSLAYKNKDSAAYPQKIREMTVNLGLKHFVEWLGFCKPEDVSANLLKSDICVLPFKDGVNERGSSFNTILSHGLPLITTRGPYSSKRLVDHNNVILVSPRDSKAIAAALEELICDRELRRRLSIAAKKLYDEEYSWSVIANKTADIYCRADSR